MSLNTNSHSNGQLISPYSFDNTVVSTQQEIHTNLENSDIFDVIKEFEKIDLNFLHDSDEQLIKIRDILITTQNLLEQHGKNSDVQKFLRDNNEKFFDLFSYVQGLAEFLDMAKPEHRDDISRINFYDAFDRWNNSLSENSIQTNSNKTDKLTESFRVNSRISG